MAAATLLPERTLAEAEESASASACSRYLESATGRPLAFNLKQTYVRLEPPSSYWALHEPDSADGAGDGFAVAARSFFDLRSFDSYAAWAARRAGGDPLGARGALRIEPDTLTVWWTLPFDPSLPGLRSTLEGDRLHPWLRGMGAAPAARPARLRYQPEIHCALRWDFEDGDPSSVYGKVMGVMEAGRAWAALNSLTHSGVGELVGLPAPYAYWPEGGLVLQTGLRTLPWSGRARVDPELAGAVIAAWHDSPPPMNGIPVFTAGMSLQRLRRSLPTFQLTVPVVARNLGQLISLVERRMGRALPETPVLAHGDYKTDQFVPLVDQRHAVIDLESIALSEPSLDLGSYAAYLMPSHPQSWEETALAEQSRERFLDAYCAAGGAYLEDRLGIHEALALATRGLTHLWARTPDWPDVCDAFITLAFERLKVRSPRETFPVGVG